MRSINRRQVIGGASAGFAIAALGRPAGILAQDDKPSVTIGSHNYTEQFILAEMCGLILEDAGFPVEYEHNLGGTVIIHEAGIAGDLDVYVEYLGTGLTILGQEYGNVVEEGTPADEAQGIVYDHVRSAYLEKWDTHWLDPIGINNTYALAMRRAHAEELGVTKISELEAHASDLSLGGSQEFIVRIDGLPGLEEAYGFAFGDSSGMESGLMYSALDNEDVDVIAAFATDGRIPALDFVLLEDDKAFFPPYHASPVVRGPLLEEAPEVENLLNQMGGLLDNTTMAELNFRVDDGGEEPRDVARSFLVEKDLIAASNE
jgi:glycine betaine/choline ABC-type transport system substrate-binding protein